jgi:hypothetical protein
MQASTYYLVRSKVDGKYLVANLQKGPGDIEVNYLMVFQENFEALSYLNTHGRELADRFTIETISSTQLKGTLLRWGYHGIGLVEDPLEPQIKFLSYV